MIKYTEALAHGLGVGDARMTERTAPMNLQNQFDVAVPVERLAGLAGHRAGRTLPAWSGDRPGAEIESSDQPDVYQGSMKVKLGPMFLTYRGTARLGSVDEDTRFVKDASMRSRGRRRVV
jgi:hypothetical protein